MAQAGRRAGGGQEGRRKAGEPKVGVEGGTDWRGVVWPRAVTQGT